MTSISVIIPLYNKERSIVSTLISVVNQSYRSFEVVIVNDGSTDDSESVVESFISDHPTIDFRLITQSNKGVSSARNAGILVAKYAYVSFLDGDDLWEPTYLEELAKLIDDFPHAGILSIGCGILSNGVKYSQQTSMTDFRGIVTNYWAKGDGLWTGSSTCLKRDALLNLKDGMFDERMAYGEDLDVWWRMAYHYPIVFLSKTLAYYRQETENRAMNKLIPFSRHIPFYIEKYKYYRENNIEFRQFFDLMMLYRLYPYALENKSDPELKRVLSQIDFSLQKRSMAFRFIFPGLYHSYMLLRGRKIK